MLVFVDESGDPGLKIDKGSSEYLIVALVLFEENEDAGDCDLRINLVRKELGLPEYFEFHFNKNHPSIRKAFLEAVARYSFWYLGIVINKKKLYGKGFQYKESFYKYATSLVFENAKSRLDEAIVTLDGSGSRDFRKQMQAYLMKRINEEKGPSKRIKRVKVQKSLNNNLIQLADMVAGAIARSYKKGKRDSKIYRRIIEHRELFVQLWPK